MKMRIVLATVVLIMPNPRGSFGYGQRFTDALTRDWGGVDYGDVMAAVDFAIGQD